VKADTGHLTAPTPLSGDHDLSTFDCGELVLNDWLRRRALRNQENGASRTYVVCEARRVAGYYSLAAGAIAHVHAAGRVKRNMPDPIPVILLGRLAVDIAQQGKGLGAGLLRDAVLRTTQAAEIAGIRAILVHALSNSAKRFYERYGFAPSPVDPMTLALPIGEAEKILDVIH
jgi:predicted N-acetyltransferase YhbS